MRLAVLSLSLRLPCACLLLPVVCDVGRLGGGVGWGGVLLGDNVKVAPAALLDEHLLGVAQLLVVHRDAHLLREPLLGLQHV